MKGKAHVGYHHFQGVVLLLLAMLALAGCAQRGVTTEAAGSGEPTELPDWLTTVHPDPGSVASPTPQVQATHGVVGALEGVRLFVDGVDVTQYADAKRGVIAYDPNRPQTPVELTPGVHEAAVRRVRLDEFGDTHEVLDGFEWRFTVQ